MGNIVKFEANSSGKRGIAKLNRTPFDIPIIASSLVLGIGLPIFLAVQAGSPLFSILILPALPVVLMTAVGISSVFENRTMAKHIARHLQKSGVNISNQQIEEIRNNLPKKKHSMIVGHEKVTIESPETEDFYSKASFLVETIFVQQFNEIFARGIMLESRSEELVAEFDTSNFVACEENASDVEKESHRIAEKIPRGMVLNYERYENGRLGIRQANDIASNYNELKELYLKDLRNEIAKLP